MVDTVLEQLEPTFRKALNGKDPYEHQIELGQEVLSGRNAVLSAGTGSGKTEAALVPALLTEKRVFLLYPTKALLQDQYGRVEEIAKSVLGERPRIVVDTGDDEDPTGYSADIVLTNLDKFVYRMFGYGKRRWGYTYPFRLVHDRRKSLLIFDEAHAYEELIFSHFWFVINKLTYEQNVQTLLLSATLPERLVDGLRDKDFDTFPRPVGEGEFFSLVADEERRGGKQFYWGTVSQEEALSKAVELFSRGQRVALVFRRIRGEGGLQDAWKQLQERVGEEMARVEDDKVKGSVLAYHGGQLPKHRRRVLDQLLDLDRERSPYLLLATHAMEVGVDISAGTMFCGAGEGDFSLGPDSFVQQIGRCARRKDETGEVYLMLEEEGEVPKFSKKLTEGHEISPEVKERLNAMNEPPSVEKAEGSVEYLHDEALYRYVYDYVPENAELWERGTLVTRSWEPSIELVFSEVRGGQTWIGDLPQWRFWRGDEVVESLSLPITQAASLASRCAWVLTGQDEDNDTPIRVALGGEKKRTLSDALGQLGYPITAGQNKYTFRDARQAPLMLLLPSVIRGDVFADENLGLDIQRIKPEEAKNFRHPHIARYEITLEKKNPFPASYVTLRWEEPKRGEE